MIPGFQGSRVASYLCTATRMLAASIWVAWHLHSLYGVGEASEVREPRLPPDTRDFFRTLN